MASTETYFLRLKGSSLYQPLADSQKEGTPCYYIIRISLNRPEQTSEPCCLIWQLVATCSYLKLNEFKLYDFLKSHYSSHTDHILSVRKLYSATVLDSSPQNIFIIAKSLLGQHCLIGWFSIFFFPSSFGLKSTSSNVLSSPKVLMPKGIPLPYLENLLGHGPTDGTPYSKCPRPLSPSSQCP